MMMMIMKMVMVKTMIKMISCLCAGDEEKDGGGDSEEKKGKCRACVQDVGDTLL